MCSALTSGGGSVQLGSTARWLQGVTRELWEALTHLACSAFPGVSRHKHAAAASRGVVGWVPLDRRRSRIEPGAGDCRRLGA